VNKPTGKKRAVYIGKYGSYIVFGSVEACDSGETSKL
jgi:hypothetical protein